MPGLLSNVFDDGSSESQSTQEYDAGADTGIDLSPAIAVSHHAEGSWQDADGTSHTYTSDTDLVLAVDVDATLAGAGSLVMSDYEED